MNNAKIIKWKDVPETVKKRLLEKWFSELYHRYFELGFGEPRPVEIDRNQKYRLKHAIFIQSGHTYYECEPKEI